VTKHLTLVICFITYGLILLGGFVHNTESSLACPDWPLCYGEFFPKMEGGVLIEHSHRLLASLVGLLSILNCFFIYRSKDERQGPNSFNFKFSLIVLGVVIIQGILGGITVIYKLPTIVSTTFHFRKKFPIT